MKRTFRSIWIFLLLGTVAAASIRLLFIENFHVSSDSMAPTLVDGDILFVFKPAFNVRLPFSNTELIHTGRLKRGQVVTFALPDDLFSTVVKRVVALGGETVSIKEGRLHVNGVAASYADAGSDGEMPLMKESIQGVSYVIRQMPDSLDEYGPVDVPPGHFFALSDNRNGTTDSREWGPIPEPCLRGRAGAIWVSFGEAGEMRFPRWGHWIN